LQLILLTRPKDFRREEPYEEKMHEEEILRKYLHQEKMCVTVERLEILRAATKFEGTFSADELCEKINNSGAKIVNSTVYRNLKLLCAAGLLEMVKTTSDGKSRFRRICSDKVICHLNCRRGNKERIIKSKKLEEAVLEICREKGFEEYGVVVRIEGIRKRCVFDTREESRNIAEKFKKYLDDKSKKTGEEE
jgi:Fur family ferric uptake transcriptional regulator